MKTQNRTRQSNITVNSTTSHPPPHKPFCFWIRSISSFQQLVIALTLYKDISIASPRGPRVLSRCLDWKTWIWSQSSSRAVVVDPRLTAGSLPLICSQLIAGCFVSVLSQRYYYRQNQIYTEVSNIRSVRPRCFGLSYCCGAVIFSFRILA